jgi:hypothetical protein
MELDWFIAPARFAEHWHQGRKLLDRSLGPGAAAAYRPIQEAKTCVLLTRILESPGDWEAHVSLYAASLSGSCHL